MKKFLFLGLWMGLGLAQAQESNVQSFADNTKAYFEVSEGRMEPGVTYSSYQLQPFAQWLEQAPAEEPLLNRFPGFREQKTLNGQKTYTLTMYVGRSKFLVNKPAKAIDLAKLMSLETLQKIDNSFSNYKQISAAESAPQKPETQAKWGYVQNPQRKWCEGTAVCIQAQFDFSLKLGFLIAGYNASGMNSRQHDAFIEIQTDSEVLAAEQVDAPALQGLTGVGSPVSSVLAQTIFYANDYFEYGKVLTVVQENPKNPESSVVSMVFAITLKDEILNKARKILADAKVDEIILGQSFVNGNNGPEKGLPGYTQDISAAMMSLLNGK